MSRLISKARVCAVQGRLSRAIACLALALGGCASVPPDAGQRALDTLARERLGSRAEWVRTPERGQAVRAEVDALLAAPLGADEAVQVALLANPGLQALYADLQVAQADLVQAGRLSNPRFSTVRTNSAESFKYETSLTFPVLGLLTLPATLRMERARFEAVRLEVADGLLQLASRVRRAHVTAVSAQAALAHLERAQVAADATAELARRMQTTGNLSRLDHLREQAFQAEVSLEVLRARGAVRAAREALARLLGVEDPSRLRLPEVPAALPAAPAALDDLEAFALARRVDVEAAKRRAQATAAALGLVRATRFVNALELGPATLLEGGDNSRKGYALSVELPLFDWGSSRVERAEAIYLQAAQRVAETALRARSEVREAHAEYLEAWELARRHRERLVPLRSAITEETLLRYNGMLVSVFELMAEARAQIAAARALVEAERDFRVAEAALLEALGGRLPPAAAVAPTAAPAGAATAPVSPAGGAHPTGAH